MEEITFWKLITSDNIQKICIPTIQRDYAQGRRDRVYLRNNFLNTLYEAIVKQKTLTLDFVYGVENENMFVPLDGQQRLTTLWLLHWYIAYKAGILGQAEIKEPLMKFSYETRISSTDFCKSLCSLMPNTTGKKIREWITQQTWFFHHYKQDPTIMGMLNMIAGTDIADNKNGEDIVDGLEEIFCITDDFKVLWETLTITNCIKFYKLKISLNDSDELYVKMNARGRQLTDFENFKTELVQHTKDDNILGEIEALDFAAKLDVQWTDIFWDNRWEDDETHDVSIDEIYFAFIRRYVRLECIRKGKDDLAKKITETFTSFEPYKEVLDRQSIQSFRKIMDNLRGRELNTQSPWHTTFDFIPKYIGKKKDDITRITNTQMLLFYGYCSYLLHGDYGSDSFLEWNRVLWNICENRGDESEYIPTMSEIDMLAPYSHSILSFLSQENDIKFKYNKDQLLEEQRKARHLEIYPAIKEMEGYSFFKGAIRFLYTGADNNEDWNSFNNKVENIKKLIPEEKEERHTIKLLTPYISEQSLKRIYCHWVSNNDEDLRTILLDSKSIPYLHNFLLQNGLKEPTSLLHQDIIDICETAFWGKGYLQTGWAEEGKYIWTNYSRRTGYYALGSFVIGNETYTRITSIIENSDIFELHEAYREQLKKRIGAHIPALFLQFKYKDISLTLFSNNTICLMTESWEDKVHNPENGNGYYFSVNDVDTEEQLIQQINSILTTYNKNSPIVSNW